MRRVIESRVQVPVAARKAHLVDGSAGWWLKSGVLLLAVLVLMLAGMGKGHATILSYKMDGLGSPSSYGFGSLGMYMGPNWSSSSNTNSKYNWKFDDDVYMDIDTSTGNATIRGSMIHMSEQTGPKWGFEASLTGAVLRWKKNSGGIGRKDYNPGTHDMQAYLDSTTNHKGVEWKNLLATVTSPYDYWGGTSGPRKATFKGLAMPNEGHVNVAEFKNVKNFGSGNHTGKLFDAWYERADCNGCTLQWGDTKGNPNPMPQPNPMPEPPVVLLMGIALAGGLVGLRRRRTIAKPAMEPLAAG